MAKKRKRQPKAVRRRHIKKQKAVPRLSYRGTVGGYAYYRKPVKKKAAKKSE